MAVVKRGMEFFAGGERLIDCYGAELCCTTVRHGTRGLQCTLRIAVHLDDGHEF